MKLNHKKGYTIVELIVVIAIIAILLAILIPTISTILKNQGDREVNTDAQLIKNLNTALKIDSDATGKKHANMTEALTAAGNAGYDVSKINAQKTNNEILWDSKNDAFVYYNADLGDVEYQNDTVAADDRLSVKKDEEVYLLWKIADSVPAYNYSLYWTGKVADIPAKLTAGFDVGKTEGVTALAYEHTGTVGRKLAFRTNSADTVLTINAPADTVSHYGEAKKIDIVAVATASYHEYGSTALVAVKQGRVVLTETSAVSAVYFTATDKNKDGTADGFEEITLTLSAETTLPDFYRDPIEIPDEGALVCKVEQEKADDEYIWLMMQGIYEQVKVSDNADAPDEWIDTSDATGNSKTLAFQIANVLGDTNATIVEETREIVPEEGKTIEETVVETGKTVEEVETVLDIQVNVKAYVTEYAATGDDLISLWMNNNIATEAAVDKAYKFNAFSDEDRIYIDAFLAAEENGEPIFSNHIEDYANAEKIEKALAYVEAQNGAEAAARVRTLLETKRSYLGWLADFEVSFDGDIAVGTVALAGHYAAFADNFNNGLWIGFGMSDIKNGNESVDLKAGKTVRLLDTAYNYTGNPDFHMNYAAICGYVKEFSCGVANLSDENIGKTITVRLFLYELDENGVETGTKIECGVYRYTLEKVSAVNAAIINK